MPRCKFCGKPAGLFRKVHAQCEAERKAAWDGMTGAAKAAILGDTPLGDLPAKISSFSTAPLVPESWSRSSLVAGWEMALDSVLEDGVLSPDEERRLLDFQAAFSLSNEELNARGALVRLGKAKILRAVIEGEPIEGMTPADGVPFNLQKSESLIWIFRDCPYYETRTRTHYEGRTAGVSIRIAKGLYYRTGGFQAHPVQTVQSVQLDTGLLGVTQKHIYFSGPNKGFRIPYNKITAFTPYTDGVGLQREAASAKPQIFVTGDGWFTYNLLVNLARED